MQASEAASLPELEAKMMSGVRVMAHCVEYHLKPHIINGEPLDKNCPVCKKILEERR